MDESAVARNRRVNRATFLRLVGLLATSTVGITGVRRALAAHQVEQTPASLTTYVHYYPWYSDAPSYRHWNGGDPNRVDPQDNIAAASYPLLAPYDSTDGSNVVGQHMAWLKRAKVDVVIVSWWGQGSYEDSATQAILDQATRNGIKVCFQIEPYAGRTALSTVDDIGYIYARYGDHAAFHRVSRPTLNGPSSALRGVFFVFDPSGSDWSAGFQSIRWTANDALILVRTEDSMMLADADVRSQINATGADGMYNYGYYDAAGAYNHPLPRSPDYVLVFAACPGFDNSRSPGVTSPTIISRNDGATYDASWTQLAVQRPEGVAIVSFNEWHEGTQIEPAVVHAWDSYTYLDYEGDYGFTGAAATTAYLSRTAYWVTRYKDTLIGGREYHVYVPTIAVRP